jgi:hypothetical protein
MSYLRYLYSLAYSGVQNVLCCVFALFSSCCEPYVACFSGLSIFCIVPSVFFNVYLKKVLM